jgi:hypothetical protein
MLGIARTLSQTSTESFSTHCNMGRTLMTNEPSEPSLCTPRDVLFRGARIFFAVEMETMYQVHCC